MGRRTQCFFFHFLKVYRRRIPTAKAYRSSFYKRLFLAISHARRVYVRRYMWVLLWTCIIVFHCSSWSVVEISANFVLDKCSKWPWMCVVSKLKGWQNACALFQEMLSNGKWQNYVTGKNLFLPFAMGVLVFPRQKKYLVFYIKTPKTSL